MAKLYILYTVFQTSVFLTLAITRHLRCAHSFKIEILLIVKVGHSPEDPSVSRCSRLVPFPEIRLPQCELPISYSAEAIFMFQCNDCNETWIIIVHVLYSYFPEWMSGQYMRYIQCSRPPEYTIGYTQKDIKPYLSLPCS